MEAVCPVMTSIPLYYYITACYLSSIMFVFICAKSPLCCLLMDDPSQMLTVYPGFLFFQVVSFLHTVLLSEKLEFSTALVVCPLNTVLNWTNEFEKWQDGLNDDEALEVCILH